MMKNFMAFQENIEYKFYEWNPGQKWYMSVEGGSNGFSLGTAEKYQMSFLFGDSVEDLKQQIKEKEFFRRYPKISEGDIECPKCEYKFNMNYFGEMDDTVDCSFKQSIECICGCKFIAKINVNISFDIKEI